MYHALEWSQMKNTRISSSKAKRLARRLLRENRHGRSYRAIVNEDYGGLFSHAVLVRIANSDGAWLPKTEEILIALGLITRRKKQHQPRDLFDMATGALRKALEQREEMPPVDPRILKQFARLGWIEKAKAQ